MFRPGNEFLSTQRIKNKNVFIAAQDSDPDRPRDKDFHMSTRKPNYLDYRAKSRILLWYTLHLTSNLDLNITIDLWQNCREVKLTYHPISNTLFLLKYFINGVCNFIKRAQDTQENENKLLVSGHLIYTNVLMFGYLSFVYSLLETDFALTKFQWWSPGP